MPRKRVDPKGIHTTRASHAEQQLAATRVLRQFRQVFNAVKAHFRSVESSAGIGGAQLWALSIIKSNKGIGVGDLAKAMDVHQSTASNLVRALVALGLVEQLRSATDGRAVALKSTAQGSRILQKAPGPFSGVLPSALASLDPATLLRLEEDLASLIDALGVDGSAAKTPLAQL